jgi:hypothetical protein
MLVSYTCWCLFSCQVFKCDWNLIILFVFVQMNKNSLQIRMMCQSSGHVIVTLYIFIEVIMKISRREQNNRPYIPSYTQVLVSFKKYMLPPPLPYFKVYICLFPLPHFASIFFAYLWSFRWPNYIVTLPRYFSLQLPHLNIPTGPPSDKWTRISANVACFIFKSLKRIQPLPVRFKLN